MRPTIVNRYHIPKGISGGAGYKPLKGFNIMTKLINFVNDESGAAAAEYDLILALIAVAIIAALGILGNNIKNTFTTVSTAMAAS